jgi:hypothetical protein
MGTSAPSIFRILKILKSHAFVYPKIMRLNIYIEICRMSVWKKVPLNISKNYFGKYKKDRFLTGSK